MLQRRINAIVIGVLVLVGGLPIQMPAGALTVPPGTIATAIAPGTFVRAFGIATSPDGSQIYVADSYGNRIYRCDTAAFACTAVAGGVSGGYSGDGGPATQARLNFPCGAAVDGLGTLYIADTYNNVIRKVDSSQNISTLALGLSGPLGVAIDSAGRLIVANGDAGTVVRLESNGTQTQLLAGLGRTASVSTDAAGGVYAADVQKSRLWHIAANGSAAIVGGTGVPTPWAPSFNGSSSLSAPLPYPFAVATAPDGTAMIAISDAGAGQGPGHVVRIRGDGTIWTIAGNGTNDTGAGGAGDGGPALAAALAAPYGLATDANGMVYVMQGNPRLRAVRLVPDTPPGMPTNTALATLAPSTPTIAATRTATVPSTATRSATATQTATASVMMPTTPAILTCTGGARTDALPTGGTQTRCVP